MQIKAWNQMLVREGLSGHVYFDRMNVGIIPSGCINRSVIKWYGVWIGMGGLGKEDQMKLNPQTQFFNRKIAPRITLINELVLKAEAVIISIGKI